MSKGDLETLKEGFAEDAEWQTSDELPLGGLTRGRDASMENFAQIPSYWSSFSVEPSEFIEAGDKVIVRGTQRATGNGGSFESPFLHLMEYRDGKVVRGEFHADSAKALKALGWPVEGGGRQPATRASGRFITSLRHLSLLPQERD